MTIREQLCALRDQLSPWARSKGGSAEPATDVVDFLRILTLKPGGFRVAILFNSEIPREDGDPSGLGMMDRSFLIAGSRGRSFTLEPGDGLTRQTGAGEALFDLVEEMREEVRLAVFDPLTTERPTYYHGNRRVEIEGYVLDAYQAELRIGTIIPGHRDGQDPEAVQ